MSILKRLFYYLFPGPLPTALLICWHEIFGESLPSMTVLVIIDLVITIPLFIFLMNAGRELRFSLKVVKELFENQWCHSFWPTFAKVSIALVWALIIFVLFKPIQQWIDAAAFAWIPDWYNMGYNSEMYLESTLRFTWWLMIPFSILMPLMEEIYFRGHLLQNEKPDGLKTPIFNTILFALYHFWSPSFFLTRAVAIFPMVYFSYRYRNLSLSILPHVLLNLMGDVILGYPG